MTIALLTAAGSGERFGTPVPKQFMCVHEKPVIVYTMEQFQKHPAVDAMIVACLLDWIPLLRAYALQYGITKLRYVTEGGETGQDSVYKCLKVLEREVPLDTTIIVHDGNRPLVSSQVINSGLAVYAEHGSAVAAIPCVEAVFRSEDGISSITSIPRESLYRTQTPHFYRLDTLLSAHEKAAEQGIVNTAATCVLMNLLNEPIYFSLGEERNIKITRAEDLSLFEALI